MIFGRLAWMSMSLTLLWGSTVFACFCNTWCFRGISLETVHMAFQCVCHISVEHAQTLNRELQILPQTPAADSTARHQQIIASKIVSGPKSSYVSLFGFLCLSNLPGPSDLGYENWELENHPFGSLPIDAGRGPWRHSFCSWPCRRFSTLRRCK